MVHHWYKIIWFSILKCAYNSSLGLETKLAHLSCCVFNKQTNKLNYVSKNFSSKAEKTLCAKHTVWISAKQNRNHDMMPLMQFKVLNNLKGLPLTCGITMWSMLCLKQLLFYYKLLDKHGYGAMIIVCNKALIWLLIHSAGTVLREYRLV